LKIVLFDNKKLYLFKEQEGQLRELNPLFLFLPLV
jgi:hypothetical protein